MTQNDIHNALQQAANQISQMGTPPNQIYMNAQTQVQLQGQLQPSLQTQQGIGNQVGGFGAWLPQAGASGGGLFGTARTPPKPIAPNWFKQGDRLRQGGKLLQAINGGPPEKVRWWVIDNDYPMSDDLTDDEIDNTDDLQAAVYGGEITESDAKVIILELKLMDAAGMQRRTRPLRFLPPEPEIGIFGDIIDAHKF